MVKTRSTKAPRQASPGPVHSTHTQEASPGASQPQGLNSETLDVNTTSVYKQTDSHVDLSPEREVHSCAALERSVPLYTSQDSGDPEQWLSKFNRYATLKKWKERTKALSLPLFLGEGALLWHDLLPVDRKSSWSIVQAEFIREFQLSSAQVFAKLNILTDRKQQQGERVQEYLLDISSQCRLLKRSEEQEVEIATNGLQPEIKRQVLFQMELLGRKPVIADVRRLGQLVESVNGPAVNTTSVNHLGAGQQHRPMKRRADHSTAPRHHGHQTKTIKFSCKKCGREHGPRDCPAWGKMCHGCSKYNHFSALCRSSRNMHVNNTNVNNTRAPNGQE